MNKNQIAKRYSRILINTVDVSGIAGAIEGFKVFSGLVDANKKLKTLFVSRIFTEEEKDSALKELFLRLKITREAEKLLRLIIQQGHLSAIKEIVQASVAAYNEKLKKMTAVVVSPATLTAKHIERLKQSIKAFTHRDIEIESQIDPSLIGGFIVKAGSTIFDSSLKGQLRLLKAELMR